MAQDFIMTREMLNFFKNNALKPLEEIFKCDDIKDPKMRKIVDLLMRGSSMLIEENINLVHQKRNFLWKKDASDIEELKALKEQTKGYREKESEAVVSLKYCKRNLRKAQGRLTTLERRIAIQNKTIERLLTDVIDGRNMTTEEAAKCLKMEPEKLLIQARKGGLPEGITWTKIGKSYRWRINLDIVYSK